MSKSYLIKNAKLLEVGHPLHLQQIDLLITDGIILEIGTQISTTAPVISGESLHLSAGWIDMRCHLTDPGLEHKDNLQNLLDSAMAGGFTKIVTLPHSEPSITDKAGVKYLQQAANYHLVDLRPTGVISDPQHAENLAELFDMCGAGAIGFTNGDGKVSNALLKKALLYTKPFGGKIITHPSDKSLEQHGHVNESENTLHTGLKTSAALAEYIAVAEQLEIAKYCEASIHFSAISCRESVQLIRTAKAAGVPVTCDVAIANLCFTDKEVLTFDENFKLYPPLRSETDRLALIEGINDNTIDAICSNHCPQNIENKQVEFDYADFGGLSIQQLFSWYTAHLSNDINMSTFIQKLTTGPAACISEPSSSVQVGKEANITVFDADTSWFYDEHTNQSDSKNAHDYNTNLRGKVLAVFNNKNQYITNQ